MSLPSVALLSNLQKYKSLRRKLRHHMSAAEKRLWCSIRKRQVCGVKFRRQYGFGRYVVDFYAPMIKLAIEIDGDTHCSSKEREHDYQRQAWLERLGIQVVRFTNQEVQYDLERVLIVIENKIRVSVRT